MLLAMDKNSACETDSLQSLQNDLHFADVSQESGSLPQDTDTELELARSTQT